MDEEIFDDYSIEERELKHIEAEAAREIENKRMRKAFDEVCATDAGLIVLKKVFELSGYDAFLMRYDSANSGEINPISSIYNLSKRELWRDLRTHIAPQHLSLIELPTE